MGRGREAEGANEGGALLLARGTQEAQRELRRGAGRRGRERVRGGGQAEGEKEKAEAAEKKKREKAEKDAAEKERKEKAKAEREEREKAEKERMESARERVARSKSTDQLDDAPALGGALGLGFLGINSSSNSLASQEDAAKRDDAKEGEKKGMTVRELAAALMAELRGLEDRVEVLGEEEGPMVALKLGAALEAVRQEPFKSI